MWTLLEPVVQATISSLLDVNESVRAEARTPSNGGKASHVLGFTVSLFGLEKDVGGPTPKATHDSKTPFSSSHSLHDKADMELPPTRDLAIAAGVALTTIFAFYHTRERRSRTGKVQRTDERVLILGASSGVGRTLAHIYAQRGARVCVVGRRQKEIEEVELECKTIQRIKESEEDRNAFSVCADFADPEQMIMLRDIIQVGASSTMNFVFEPELLTFCVALRIEWQGVDTVIITAGVSSLQPLLSVANLKHDSDHVELEGVQRVVDVAHAALHSNFVGPLVSATTFVRANHPSLSYNEASPDRFRYLSYSLHQIHPQFSSCPPWPP